MNSGRGALGSALAQACAAALTTWLTILAWGGFSESPGSYLRPLLLVAVVVAVSGTALRWFQLPTTTVIVGQLLVGGALVDVLLTGSPVPLGARWEALTDAVTGALNTSRVYAAPVPDEAAGIHPLLIPLGAACIVLVDACACTWRRVSLAGLPLLTIYSIPVSLLRGEVAWWIFALAGGGFLLMLFLNEDEQIARWGRSLGGRGGVSETGRLGGRSGAVRLSAIGIASVATLLAVILPAYIPTLQLAVFGNGPGAGNGDVKLDNPMTDLRRNLQRGDDIALLTLQTSDPQPSYLRISVLNRFSNNEWTSGNREIPQEQRPTGTMPPLTGVLAATPRREFDYTVAIDDAFKSSWLPTMSPISAIDAGGNWRYDVRTMDFLAADDDTTTTGLNYTMTGVRLDLTATQLAAAPAAVGSVREDFIALPEDLPAAVRELAIEVTAEQPTRYQRAVALQDWFRRDGGFTYDLQTDAGNGSDELLAFLDAETGRVGYCEQFASAMAVMARSLGIPARVAVGFLRPERIGASTWQYSAWDLHAWPELFFPGAGWVRFEPTPGARAGSVPGYTRETLPNQPSGNSSGPTQAPSDELPSRGSSSSAVDPQPDAGQDEPGAAGGGVGWLPILGTAGGLALVGLVGFAPRLLRRVRRDRRLIGDPTPEAAWHELRDTAIDLGLPWPGGLSPQATGVWVAEHFGSVEEASEVERPRHGAGLAPSAEAALRRLVAAVERGRYARLPGALPALRADLLECTSGLKAGATPSARRRATWLPRSVLGLGWAGVSHRPANNSRVEVVGHGGVIDHMGG